jgi:hypothetical protein
MEVIKDGGPCPAFDNALPSNNASEFFILIYIVEISEIEYVMSLRVFYRECTMYKIYKWNICNKYFPLV